MSRIRILRLALAVPGLPLLIQLAELPFRGFQHRFNRIFLRDAAGRLHATAGQSLLQIVFVAHQAWVDTDAVIRTLFRLFVTRRTLLEWEIGEQGAILRGRARAGVRRISSSSRRATTRAAWSCSRRWRWACR